MEKVYLINAPKYDPKLIAAAVRKAARDLNVALDKDRAILLADCPWAHPRFAPDAHSHPDFIAAVAGAFKGKAVTLAANSLTGFPTRYSSRHAGYGPLASRLNGQLIPLDEAATQRVAIKGGKAITAASLPSVWMNAPLRVLLPRLRQSTLVPFGGALRQMQSLLSPAEQLDESHRLPEKMIDLVPVTPVDLIVVDAIRPLHNGGELSGQPVDLGVLIIGANPVAVDLVCAAALGLDPARVDFLQEARERGIGPASLKQVQILGDLTLADLRKRAARVTLADPDPVHFPLPPQVKVLRSEKARQAGAAGALADVFYILKRAGVSLKSAPQTTIVIGAVEGIPPGKDEYATLIFMDDTSRGDFSGYGRIVRLAGRNIPMSQVLLDVPYAMKAINMRSELGVDLMAAKFLAALRRLLPRK